PLFTSAGATAASPSFPTRRSSDLRYANGDTAVMGSSARCACGRTLPRLASVEGRVAQTLRDAQGKPVSGLLFNLIFTPLARSVKDRKSTRLNSSHVSISYAAFCLK